MRDYGKVFSRIWESTDFRSMNEDGRTLVLYLLTCQHGTIAGVFRVPDGYACEDLQWSPERVIEAFKETLRKGFANRCETSKWVWVIKFLEWNPPENPNQMKAAKKVVAGVPAECGWKLEFMRVCGPLLGLEHHDQSNPSETLPKPFLNQEQEQEQEQEQDKEPTAPSAAKLPPCPHRKVIDLFAQHLPELPQPKPELWDGQRAKDLTARWKWLLTAKRRSGERYATNEAEALDWLGRYFAHVSVSDFLTGRNGQWTGCDLGWLIKSDNFVKVTQGNYDNKKAAA